MISTGRHCNKWRETPFAEIEASSVSMAWKMFSAFDRGVPRGYWIKCTLNGVEVKPEDDIPFRTAPEQVANINSIGMKMLKEGVNSLAIVRMAELASTDQGIYDLMELWSEENDRHERNKIILDLQHLIHDYEVTND